MLIIQFDQNHGLKVYFSTDSVPGGFSYFRLVPLVQDTLVIEEARKGEKMIGMGQNYVIFAK